MAAIVSSARSDSTGRRTPAVSGGMAAKGLMLAGICGQATRTERSDPLQTAKNARDSWGSTEPMTTAHRISNLAGVIVPFAGLLAAIVLLWNTLVDWSDIAALAIMYVVCGFGVTVGFHRMLTHRSFATYKPLQYVWAVLGSMAVQGPVISWVADHRKHHAHTDKDGDPHSPHTHGGHGFLGAVQGLWYAHMGWLFDRAGQADPARYARDLYEDPAMRRIDRLFWAWLLLGIAIPFGLGYAMA